MKRTNLLKMVVSKWINNGFIQNLQVIKRQNKRTKLKMPSKVLKFETLEERQLLSINSELYSFCEMRDQDRIDETTSAQILMCQANVEAGKEAIIAQASVREAIKDQLIEFGQNPESLTMDYIFNLNSCPESTYTIYLDFNGHVTTGTAWNIEFAQDKIITPAYDTDGNTSSFSNDELLDIYEIWYRVSEDYIPFNVNVTTNEPGLDALIKSNSSDTSYGIRVCIGEGYWYPGGGIAYPNSFTLPSDTPCFIFPNNLPSAKNVAESSAHEVGHTLGLAHDGNPTDGEYYLGADGWAPIMGAGYYQPLTQWSKGEYEGATNKEDDLLIISTKNGFSYRVDDHGNSLATATILPSNKSATIGSGIIEKNTDSDWFKFTNTESIGSLRIGGMEGVTNLDILVELYNSNGTRIETFNPLDTTYVLIDLSTLAVGSYYFRVTGTGKTDESGKVYYTDYASLGAYTFVTSPVPLSCVVTTELDTVDEHDGLLSLREALSLVKDNGTIIFDPSLKGKTITLNGNEIPVSRSVTIDAANLWNDTKPGITINANGKSRIFNMDSNTAPTLTIIGLTITGGNSSGVGGAIATAGNVLVKNCVVSKNKALHGGAFGSESKYNITIIQSVISGNKANYGGGIYCKVSSGVVTVDNSLIMGNSGS